VGQYRAAVPPGDADNDRERPDVCTTVRETDAATVLTVRGVLDNATAERFRAAAEAAVARLGERRLVIDLSGVEFLGTAGLAVLVGIHHALAAAGPLRIVTGGAQIVIRPIQVSGLDRLWRLHHGFEEALAEQANTLG
jgi:anti-sigma B factor antagonist